MKDIKIIMLVFTCSIILFLCFYFPNKITEMQNTQKKLSDLIGDLQTKNEFHSINFELNNNLSGIIAPDLFCIGNKIDKKKLSELTVGRKTLIFRHIIDNTNCNSCNQNEHELKAFNDAFIETSDLAIILSSYDSNRDFLLFKKDNDLSISIFNIPLEAFDWVAEKNKKSYYFVLHSDMKISHIYVPNKEFPDLNKQYLEGVKRFLSE